MVDLPWRGTDRDGEEGEAHPDAAVACEFQDGTLAVYETEVRIERASRSKFDDKTIPADEITGVDYSGGITVGYIQIQQAGFESTTGGLLSDPVDENTLHFQRAGRDCATEARDAILERATA